MGWRQEGNAPLVRLSSHQRSCGGKIVVGQGQKTKPISLKKENQEGKRGDTLSRYTEKVLLSALPLPSSLPSFTEWAIPSWTYHSPALIPTESMWDSQATMWVCHWSCRRTGMGGGGSGVWKCLWILGKTPWHLKDSIQDQDGATMAYKRLLEIIRIQKPFFHMKIDSN